MTLSSVHTRTPPARSSVPSSPPLLHCWVLRPQPCVGIVLVEQTAVSEVGVPYDHTGDGRSCSQTGCGQGAEDAMAAMAG